MTNPDGFLARLAARDAQTTHTAQPAVRVTAPAYNLDVTVNEHPYVQKALDDEVRIVATAANGTRNDTLNRAAFNLARFVNENLLSADQVTTALTAAGLAAGLTHAEIDTCLRGDRHQRDSAAKRVGPAVPPPRITATNGRAATPRGIPAETAPATAAQAASTNEDDDEDYHALQVRRRAYELRVNDEAKTLWNRQQAAAAGRVRPQLTNLVDLLAQPDEDAQYRIHDLLPTGGRVLLAAQYKAGKTSMIANLLRSLVDGHDFLGRLPTTPVNRVVLIDTELDERMLRRWLRDQNIVNQAAIDIVCLRGRLTTFDILDDAVRAEWAADMSGADFVILDCLRPCLDALGLSEDKEAGRFLTAFDGLCKESGASEATVVHHMGHSQERSRGDSRLLDWPDVLWKIVRDDEEGDTGDRYFSAMGRDVNIPEARLDWTPETRSLLLCEGGRAEKRARNMGVDLVEILSDPANTAGLSQNKLVGKLKALGNSRDGSRRAVQLGIEDGLIITVEGPRNTVLHVLNPSRRT